ncbi:MAG TPA: bifunctional pyr operon transcriptional regulator/uracil phosphoribosyltransferase PyrR [Candidatus Dormibacteraeota bacterium]
MATRLRGTVMDAEQVRRSLSRIAHEIVERNKATDQLVIVGVLHKGDLLARRLAASLSVPFGALDVTNHRDDRQLREPLDLPASDLPPVDGATVVLVDDVIYKGRTARAAMDALMDHGRPRAIQLAVLVDRGHRELPIRPDYVGKNIATAESERVEVLLEEEDGLDAVVVLG